MRILAHLNARETTLAFASRAPQPDIQRCKSRIALDGLRRRAPNA